jgi:hypothetical protein
VTTLKFDDVVLSLLLEEMRRKNIDSQSTNALFIRGRSLDRNKNKFSGRRSKSLGKSLNKCWKCGEVGHFKKDCISKSVERGKGSDDVSSLEGKTSLEEGGMCTWLLQAHIQIMMYG